jgi:hypothetical protein
MDGSSGNCEPHLERLLASSSLATRLAGSATRDSVCRTSWAIQDAPQERLLPGLDREVAGLNSLSSRRTTITPGALTAPRFASPASVISGVVKVELLQIDPPRGGNLLVAFESEFCRFTVSSPPQLSSQLHCRLNGIEFQPTDSQSKTYFWSRSLSLASGTWCNACQITQTLEIPSFFAGSPAWETVSLAR